MKKTQPMHIAIRSKSRETAEQQSQNIKEILERVLQTGYCTYHDACKLLSLDPESPEAAIVRRAAHTAALSWTGGKGSVWFAIGIDSAPCPNNCDFCSFGEKWGIVQGYWQLEPDSIVDLIKRHDAPGVGYIVLRTTDLYPLEQLMALARRTPPLKHARLVANIGDFSKGTALALHKAGFHMVYHALRLREGRDTQLVPEDRLRTMKAVTQSPLNLAALADPIGSEHSAQEIARSLLLHKKAGAVVQGAMARINVPGTPKADIPSINASKLAQITAVARLVAGPRVRDVCAHPPDACLLRSGANVIVVESGAIPRDRHPASDTWRGFSVNDALTLLHNAGFSTPDKTNLPCGAGLFQ